MSDTNYLHVENWPDDVDVDPPVETDDPNHDPEGIDNYIWTHPKAASISGKHMGDICPQCGVPIPMDERVVAIDGVRGVLREVSSDENPVPTYHIECWGDRQQQLNHTITEYGK